MTVKLLLNLGTRHPVVSGSNDVLCRGSVHTFSDEQERRLVEMNHAEYVKQPEAQQPKRKRRTSKAEKQ